MSLCSVFQCVAFYLVHSSSILVLAFSVITACLEEIFNISVIAAPGGAQPQAAQSGRGEAHGTRQQTTRQTQLSRRGEVTGQSAADVSRRPGERRLGRTPEAPPAKRIETVAEETCARTFRAPAHARLRQTRRDSGGDMVAARSCIAGGSVDVR